LNWERNWEEKPQNIAIPTVSDTPGTIKAKIVYFQSRWEVFER